MQLIRSTLNMEIKNACGAAVLRVVIVRVDGVLVDCIHRRGIVFLPSAAIRIHVRYAVVVKVLAEIGGAIDPGGKRVSGHPGSQRQESIVLAKTTGNMQGKFLDGL